MSTRTRDLRATMRAAGSLIRGRVPGQLVIQYTDHCNARCPQCGMRVTESFTRTRLDPGAVSKILEAAAEQGFMSVSITGGEPFLFSDTLVNSASATRGAARTGSCSEAE